jgi:DNA-binding CsgD family transcriptional regulator
MFLLPPRIRSMLENRRGTDSRVFSLDAELVTVIHETARQQGCSEQELLAELVDAGQEDALKNRAAEACWDSLSEREQEVLALVCLGQRNYEIAGVLGIAPETVKTHLQHIFRKFACS